MDFKSIFFENILKSILMVNIFCSKLKILILKIFGKENFLFFINRIWKKKQNAFF